MSGVAALLDRVLADARGSRPVVIIDGGSGSGKTTLAGELLAEFRARGFESAQLVSLDDAYPGWGGLAAASQAVHRDMLHPEQLGPPHRPGYESWDWAADAPGPWRELDGSAPLIVEGCGSLSHESAPLATTSVWIELDEAHRKPRALSRPADVGVFAEFWEMWAAQEREHWRRNAPFLLADVIIEAVPGA
ncbi:ATP-binding protein [Pseudoclavibacter sp. AY1H1]|uniref:ATP-binding protein n=1 Tax=Pseudoclavibacter sp. AY1H1 TaxID=2080584 RepID=UPI0021570997|nr:ATP-binding protein [Pseudoclavibacter sp. AY1H1]